MAAAVRLDAEQCAFVDAPADADLSLKAGAGSGKTEVVVQRIRRLRELGKSVLVFSHANKTVDEIRARLRRAGVAGVSVLTMHKYCIQRMRREHLPVPDCPDDLIEEAAGAFEQGRLRTFEDVVIVDEAQDLSSGQMRIVLALLQHPCNAAVRVTMVGDLEQSIYGFQGSDPAHFRGFEAQLPLAHRFQIRTNYRSSNALVVAAANALAVDDIAQGSAVRMLPRPGAAPERSLRIVGCDRRRDPHALAHALLGHIARLRASPETRADSVMVLAHTNGQLDGAFNVCMAHGLDSVLYSSQRSGEYRRTPPRLRRRRVLQFLTVHGSKGGEAHHVLLLSGEDRGDHLELDAEGSGSESRRLLYVALTRAIKSFTVLVEVQRADSQPCRWLSGAWSCFETVGAERYRSGRNRPEVARSSLLRLTKDLLPRGGVQGLKACLREHAAAPPCAGGDAPADRQRLFYTSVLDLETSEDAGETIARQAPKAYELGLELFMGVQFENHTALALADASLARRAAGLLDVVSRLHVNADVWRAYKGVDEHGRTTDRAAALQEALLRWWRERAGHYFEHIYRSLDDEEDDLWAGVFEGLPSELHSQLVRAIRHANLKFEHLAALRDHWKQRVFEQRARFQREQGAYRPPSFDAFFRPFNENLDAFSQPGYMTKNLRRVVARCFSAAEGLVHGSASAYDLCLYSALECCSRELRKSDEGLASSGEQWQAILHLAQRESSAVYLRVEDLVLDETATRQIREDAEEVRRLLGDPLRMHEESRVSFSCRSDYGDAALAAEGAVLGVCDYLFPDGVLEVKATLTGVTAEHAAQVLWYSCAAGAQRAYLWDVYHRRLLVWEQLPEARRFFSACLLEYLRRNPPPGCTHSKVIWPQALRLPNIAPSGADEEEEPLFFSVEPAAERVPRAAEEPPSQEEEPGRRLPEGSVQDDEPEELALPGAWSSGSSGGLQAGRGRILH
jgi:AAA domain/UvrD-like helicase C-terminal domain